MNPRFLTKSRFKLALGCPAKLYYTGKKEYANQSIDDPFMLALADGGFQVGELAKCYYPGGHDINTLDYQDALLQTNELLELENVIIYEAAIRYGNFFIRADILVKEKNSIKLIEVKAKSFDPSADVFANSEGSILANWKPYLYDIAFQKYVLNHSFPQYFVTAFLMMANKIAVCPTDGLNQKFKFVKDSKRRKRIAVSENLTEEDLSNPILAKINVDIYCNEIYGEEIELNNQLRSFTDYADFLSRQYFDDKKICSPISTACATCEFRTTKEDSFIGLKSGFEECWKEQLQWTKKDFEEQTVLEIWNYRKKNQLINEGRIKLIDVTKDDFNLKTSNKLCISTGERQWLQVEKVQKNDSSSWVDYDKLKNELNSWRFPLHFIDFETAMVAIPFNKGRHPYEGIAFQFSHHVVYENGDVEHYGQYLNATVGAFPNYDFIRNLKLNLEQDIGSIFRYAAHENTFLNLIYRQLIEDQNEIPDREELCNFIKSITQSVNGSKEEWAGNRNMIDMCELVKRHYYDPAMKGSNSIKKVLPAILNSSMFLKEKYSQAIYGAAQGVKSLNFKNWIWVKFNEGMVIDPYKLLPKMFQDVSEKNFEILSDSDELKDGGAALTAYARMQFEEMSEYERSEIEKGLLQYCELDTMAMVMIYEGWKDMCK